MSGWQALVSRARRLVRPTGQSDGAPAGWTLEVVVEPDTLDGGWVAVCPAFPGAAAQGDTRREAVDALVPVVLDFIELKIDEQLSAESVPDRRDGAAQSIKVSLTP